MLVGIIGAMQVEVDNLVARMDHKVVETISLINFYRGTLDDYEVVIAACGPGKVNAALCAQAMIITYGPDIVINTGVAGGLSPKLHVGDCVVATSVVQYDMDTTAVGDPIGMISGLNVVEFPSDEHVMQALVASLKSMDTVTYHQGMIATGDKFLTSLEEKAKILENFDALAVDMESGSIGHVCFSNKKPFGIIRSISDNANDESVVDFFQFLDEAAGRAAEAVRLFLQKIQK